MISEQVPKEQGLQKGDEKLQGLEVSMKDVLEEHEWGRKKRWRGQEGTKTAPPSPISDPANLPQLPRESPHLLWTPSPSSFPDCSLILTGLGGSGSLIPALS